MLMEAADIRFGIFVLDTRPQHRALLAHDKPVEIDAKALEILEYLVHHRDRAVHPDEILKNVYRVTVSPNNVTVQISNIRRALKLAGCTDDLIHTWKQPTRYQFVGEVTGQVTEPETMAAPAGAAVPPESPAGPAHLSAGPEVTLRKRWLAAALLLAIVIAGLAGYAWLLAPSAAPPVSIVVRPFRAQGADAEHGSLDAALADSVTDDLAADLGRVPLSTVIGRASATAVRDMSPQQIGRELGVQFVLDGTLMDSDGRYHVTVELTDAATGRTLWTGTIDLARDHEAELRQDIVSQIASQLHLRLDDIESSAARQDRPGNPNVLDLFFQARHVLDWDDTIDGFQGAQALLEKAVSKQPDFADAQAELGLILLKKITNFDDPADGADLAEAKSAIRQALASSSQNTTARVAHARELELEGKCAEAGVIADQILSVEPSNLDARTVLARCAQSVPRLDEAASQYRTILRLDPFNPGNKLRHLALGTILLVQGKVTEAISHFDKCMEDAKPSNLIAPAEECRLFLLAALDENRARSEAQAGYAAYAKDFAGRTVWRLSAYFPPGWLRLPGFRTFENALMDAGMPAFADERQPGLPDGAPCADGDFAPTPLHLPGGEVIGSEEFARRLATLHPLVIDVGRGTETEPGWLDYATAEPTQSQSRFARQAAQERSAADRHAPIIVLGDGVTGCAAYTASLSLMEAGYTSIAWFRGGEEAWHKYKLTHDNITAAAAGALLMPPK